MNGMYAIAGGLDNDTAFKGKNMTSFTPQENERDGPKDPKHLWYQFMPDFNGIEFKGQTGTHEGPRTRQRR
ncbi:hypothetical protein OPT61_g3032 [Boeremia exigua]|uniref:Uncharacterized protein n=1 Tax=Boeremia exigua TaxID=749465 RepID=A0ACC2IJB2_9PLEO|nr:hypothetical protein OPT61_g3032 [Boeremia exigua]